MAKRISYSRIPTATNVAFTETIDGATILLASHSAVTNTATIDAYRREMVRTDASMGADQTPWTSDKVIEKGNLK